MVHLGKGGNAVNLGKGGNAGKLGKEIIRVREVVHLGKGGNAGNLGKEVIWVADGTGFSGLYHSCWNWVLSSLS